MPHILTVNIHVDLESKEEAVQIVQDIIEIGLEAADSHVNTKEWEYEITKVQEM